MAFPTVVLKLELTWFNKFDPPEVRVKSTDIVALEPILQKGLVSVQTPTKFHPVERFFWKSISEGERLVL